MSPDFMSYLDIDQKNKVFIIRDTITQQIKYNIPQWLMDCENEDIHEVIHRFKWRDNSQI